MECPILFYNFGDELVLNKDKNLGLKKAKKNLLSKNRRNQKIFEEKKEEEEEISLSDLQVKPIFRMSKFCIDWPTLNKMTARSIHFNREGECEERRGEKERKFFGAQ